MIINRLRLALMTGAIATMALTQGCSSSDGSSPLCCTEYKPGAQVDANIGGSAQSKVAVQALADISGIASGAIQDLTTACRGIAQDLDADPTAAAAADDPTKSPNDQMKAWCQLAVTQIGAYKAQAAFTIVATPPVCEASVSAKLDCQAQCNGGVKCDFKANPPKCTGGKLTVDCKGDCTAMAGASVSCTGSCDANCTGSCTAQGGVECTGKCDGTCEASAMGGTGSGIQADGTCKGTCKGTCSVTPPSVKCSGSCNGSCSGTCKGSAMASVKCDGTCMGDFEPVSCSGGKLEGGCTADAKCDANCNGSVQAKAQCTPPSVTIQLSGTGDATAFGKLKATLEANLPLVFALKAKFAGLADVTASLSGNITAVVDIKAACIPVVVASAGSAVSNLSDSVTVTANLAGSVGSQ